MFKFEWDDQKAASNLRKYGVSIDEAVNKALATMLAFAQETQGLTGRPKRTSRKRAAV